METGRTVLIVDDDKHLCELIHNILENEDFQIECAYTLAEAHNKWKTCKPEIILLDIHLPDGNSLDLIESNKELLADCKVIAVTADHKPATRKRAVAVGIEHYLEKPFSLKQIRVLVNEIIVS
jgi:DNA-binding response OmpR family regulator